MMRKLLVIGAFFLLSLGFAVLLASRGYIPAFILQCGFCAFWAKEFVEVVQT